ncbi:hypothetical protein [Neptuniibacter sp. QD37_11]|uniref:hypothetical protein n=1 Tax=Neptuniibacter sp. QD37_11 TaxID=3398209 RepID=UPI0039F60034
MNRHMILLNGSGDTTISWDASDDEKMHQMIEQMLEKGYSFFVVQPKWLGLSEKKVEVNRLSDLKKSRKISLPDALGDAVLAGLCESSEEVLSVMKTPTGDLEAGERIREDTNIVDLEGRQQERKKKAREIAQQDTMALRPLAGG